jgi:hypothetical protein
VATIAIVLNPALATYGSRERRMTSRAAAFECECEPLAPVPGATVTRRGVTRRPVISSSALGDRILAEDPSRARNETASFPNLASARASQGAAAARGTVGVGLAGAPVTESSASRGTISPHGDFCSSQASLPSVASAICQIGRPWRYPDFPVWRPTAGPLCWRRPGRRLQHRHGQSGLNAFLQSDPG